MDGEEEGESLVTEWEKCAINPFPATNQSVVISRDTGVRLGTSGAEMDPIWQLIMDELKCF
jgi:hypothetical protein